MYRKHLDRWVERGIADGYSYLIICFDTFDAIREDPDGGYYPVYVHTREDVASEISARQTGHWIPTDVRDFCEFVVELKTYQDGALELPEKWMKGKCDH